MTDALGNLSSKEPYQVSRGNDNSSTGSAENTYTIPLLTELPREAETTDLETDLYAETDSDTDLDAHNATRTPEGRGATKLTGLRVAAAIVATVAVGAAGGALAFAATLAWPWFAAVGIGIIGLSVLGGDFKGVVFGAAVALGPIGIGCLTLAAMYKTFEAIVS